MPAPATNARDAFPALLQDYSRRLVALEQVSRTLSAVDWKPLSLEHSWKNVAASPTAAYYKDLLGVVHMKGRIEGGSTASVAGTLPAGYRPGESSDLFSCGAYSGTAPIAAFAAVAATGTIEIYFAGGVLSSLSLVNISFYAEN